MNNNNEEFEIEEIIEEDENKHRFDYLLSLNHEDLITEIRKIESEKPKFDFSKMNSKKLIAMNKNEVDEKTIPLNDWNKMKHFVVTDVKNSIFTYPIYDESLEYEEYNKTDYIPPEGFEFMDCSVALKPLGIAIVTIKTGRKIRNPRDGRFLSENVKRVEEIFVYSFEDEKWFVAKKNNEDYLRRLDITFYIETAYRSYLPKFYKSVDLLKKIEFYDSSMKNDEVLQRLTESRSNLNDVFKNSLFVLLFYNEFDEKMYQFFNLEIDNLIARLDRCIEYLEFLPQESFFVHTKVFDMEIEQKEALKKLNDYVDSTSIAIRQLLGNISLKRFNEAYLKGNSSVPLHQKTDFEDMIKKGYYLNPFKSTMKNINTVFGEYQPIKTLGQVLIRLLKTDFPMSEENLEYIQYEIDEFLKLHLEKANQQDWTAPCQVDSGNNKN